MLLTIPQAAEKLGTSRQRVWLLVKDGRIKATQAGKTWLIKQRDLDKFSETRQNGGRPTKLARG